MEIGREAMDRLIRICRKPIIRNVENYLSAGVLYRPAGALHQRLTLGGTMSIGVQSGPQAEPGKELHPDQCNRLFAHGLHEENVFYNRLNFFMVCESLLFAGAVSGVMEGEESARPIIIFICIIGLLVSFLWWFAQVNKLVLLKTLEDRLMDVFPEIRESIDAANRKRRVHVWSASAILAHALPVLFLLAWLYLLCHMLWVSGETQRHLLNLIRGAGDT